MSLRSTKIWVSMTSSKWEPEKHFHLPQMNTVSSELSAQSFTKSHSLSFRMQCLEAHVNSSAAHFLFVLGNGEQSRKETSSTATSPM